MWYFLCGQCGVFMRVFLWYSYSILYGILEALLRGILEVLLNYTKRVFFMSKEQFKNVTNLSS